MNKQLFECEFCGKKFVRERTLLNHICEKKRRWNQRDEKHVRLAFNSWLRWYQITGTNPHKKTRTYSDFMKSKEYISFVKFGRHVTNTNLINPNQFIDFVIKNNLKLKDWTRDSVFEIYVKQTCRNEDVQTALERFVKLSEKWANEHDENWLEFFKQVNTNLALHWIRTGQISPWILYNAKTANQLLDRMNQEQLDYVNNIVEPNVWKGKMAKNKKDTKFVVEILEEMSI